MKCEVSRVAGGVEDSFLLSVDPRPGDEGGAPSGAGPVVVVRARRGKGETFTVLTVTFLILSVNRKD